MRSAHVWISTLSDYRQMLTLYVNGRLGKLVLVKFAIAQLAPERDIHTALQHQRTDRDACMQAAYSKTA